MKKILNPFFLAMLVFAVLSACSDSDDMKPKDKLPDAEAPTNFEVQKGGTLTAQSSTNTRGMFQIVKDDTGAYFVRLTSDFTTKFSTGTVTVYLSDSDRLDLSQSGSFQLVSVVGKAGEHFFPLAAAPDSKFTHGIIWCGAAAIPFGFTLLQ
ncbi:hypothetical protein ACFOSV_16740 [Algoriphagus namhaensis]|uniref:Electron transfer DM13 n=1 Tax=Algoriphagus namhaensis TaxID=915353 RepID=A0ABV8AW55_9BACT